MAMGMRAKLEGSLPVLRPGPLWGDNEEDEEENEKDEKESEEEIVGGKNSWCVVKSTNKNAESCMGHARNGLLGMNDGRKNENNFGNSGERNVRLDDENERESQGEAEKNRFEAGGRQMRNKTPLSLNEKSASKKTDETAFEYVCETEEEEEDDNEINVCDDGEFEIIFK